MDERRLTELFREAAGDPPPAAFDARDIAQASRVADARRRRRIRGWGGAAACVLALGGLGAGADALFGHAGGGTTASARPADATAPTGPTAGQGAGSGPGSPGARAQAPTEPEVTPEMTTNCGAADATLATALAGQLPASGVLGPAAVDFPCPSGARSAAYRVSDGTNSGLFEVVFIPAGGSFGTPAIAASTAWDVATTPSGGRLIVLSVPAGSRSTAGSTGPTSDSAAPFANLVTPIARELAATR